MEDESTDIIAPFLVLFGLVVVAQCVMYSLIWNKPSFLFNRNRSRRPLMLDVPYHSASEYMESVVLKLKTREEFKLSPKIRRIVNCGVHVYHDYREMGFKEGVSYRGWAVCQRCCLVSSVNRMVDMGPSSRMEYMTKLGYLVVENPFDCFRALAGSAQRTVGFEAQKA